VVPCGGRGAEGKQWDKACHGLKMNRGSISSRMRFMANQAEISGT
jgi:hypothetical protein